MRDMRIFVGGQVAAPPILFYSEDQKAGNEDGYSECNLNVEVDFVDLVVLL